MISPGRIPIFDGHNDVVSRLYRRGGMDAASAFLDGEDKGHLDCAKHGAADLPAACSQSSCPPRSEESSFAACRRGDGCTTGRLCHGVAAFPDRTGVCRGAFASAAMPRYRKQPCRRCVAAVLHIEGAEAIDADFAILEALYAAGLRSLGPVWSRPNVFGHGVPFRCPSSPDTGPGLTDLCKALIGACNRLRILIDLSHLNERGFWDVAAISNAPLVATHSNAHAFSPHSRNLTDRQLAAIGKTGGLVGVNFAVSFFVRTAGADNNTPTELIIRHIEHLLEHVGEDGVGFGSDFYGAEIREPGNAAGLQILVQGMRKRGFGRPLIEKLCFRNWLRVLARTWGPAQTK